MRPTPNLMVVVPHSHDVVLTYGTTLVDWAGGIASGLGIIGLAAVAALFSPAATSGRRRPGHCGTITVRDSSDRTDDEDSPLRGA